MICPFAFLERSKTGSVLEANVASYDWSAILYLGTAGEDFEGLASVCMNLLMIGFAASWKLRQVLDLNFWKQTK